MVVQAGRQAGRQADRQTDRQTDMRLDQRRLGPNCLADVVLIRPTNAAFLRDPRKCRRLATSYNHPPGALAPGKQMDRLKESIRIPPPKNPPQKSRTRMDRQTQAILALKQCSRGPPARGCSLPITVCLSSSLHPAPGAAAVDGPSLPPLAPAADLSWRACAGSSCSARKGTDAPSMLWKEQRVALRGQSRLGEEGMTWNPDWVAIWGAKSKKLSSKRRIRVRAKSGDSV
jgi:hypothetical protein